LYVGRIVAVTVFNVEAVVMSLNVQTISDVRERQRVNVPEAERSEQISAR